MYKFSVSGAVIALVENPIWIHVQRNGCYGQCDRVNATGVAINSTPYNLSGHDIGGVATVDYEEVQSGTYLLKQEANIDYLSMMTGIDLPNEEPEQPVLTRMAITMNEHSAKFEKVKGYYEAGLWTEIMVRNAAKNPPASPWITEEEADEIIYDPMVESDIANEE